MKVGGTYTDVPWSVSVLSGSLSAKFNFWFFSTELKILEWEGFKVASDSLFQSYYPVVEKSP
jgi:hypothetical protein